MTPLMPQILFFMEVLVFTSAVFMHLTKRNRSLIILYIFQSALVTFSLFTFSFQEPSLLLILATLLTFSVKAVIAPVFFFRLITRYGLKFSASAYLSTPLTLIALAAITVLTRSYLFFPLATLAPSNENILLLSIATILISLFLIINRKGVLSQVVGILSLENGIVSFASFAHLEQSPGLQLGITFDILMWIAIAGIFTSMIYRHFGSFDVSSMQRLKE